ncbi:MAG: hypothetical protein HZC14_00645 [Candidatus Niyogibacteria bacterium]|nr:hypothetical protein [Candidatus Niyogibacteria bacterium]
MGNVGIGTTTPAYKLQVAGDVAATGFVNVSTREAKRDIAFLGEADYDFWLSDSRKEADSALGGSTSKSCAKRLGLIAEQAPVEILSPDHKGVDLYKMTAFLWSGVKAQQKQIEELAARLEKVEGILASADPMNAPQASSTPTVASSLSLDGVLEILKTAGVYISNGVAQMQKLMATQVFADEVYTRQLCIEDVCINKTQLQALLRNANLLETVSSVDTATSAVPEIIADPAPVGVATSTPISTLNVEIASTTLTTDQFAPID